MIKRIRRKKEQAAHNTVTMLVACGNKEEVDVSKEILGTWVMKEVKTSDGRIYRAGTPMFDLIAEKRFWFGTKSAARYTLHAGNTCEGFYAIEGNAITFEQSDELGGNLKYTLLFDEKGKVLNFLFSDTSTYIMKKEKNILKFC